MKQKVMTNIKISLCCVPLACINYTDQNDKEATLALKLALLFHV